MKISRVQIHLTLLTFFKSLLLSVNNKKKEVAFKSFEKMIGKKYFNLVGMCRTGLILSLNYLKQYKPDKNEIIIFSYNLPEFVEIIKNKGFIIKFIDISENGLPSIEDIKININNKTSAILMTNMFNDVNFVKQVKKITDKNNIVLIEDCAIFLGNYHQSNEGKIYSGSIGDISLFSFGIMKNLCAIFGGAVATNNENIHKFFTTEIKKLKSFPNNIFFKKLLLFFALKFFLSNFIFKLFFHKLVNYAHKKNKKMLLKKIYPSLNFIEKTEIPDYFSCKIHPLSEKIFINKIINNDLIKDFETRKKNNSLYLKYINQSNNLYFPKLNDLNFQNYLEFPLIAFNKDKLVKNILDNKFDIRVFYYFDCSFLDKNKNYYNFKNSKIFESKIICLPNHAGINEKYIIKISDLINNE